MDSDGISPANSSAAWKASDRSSDRMTQVGDSPVIGKRTSTSPRSGGSVSLRVRGAKVFERLARTSGQRRSRSSSGQSDLSSDDLRQIRSAIQAYWAAEGITLTGSQTLRQEGLLAALEGAFRHHPDRLEGAANALGREVSFVASGGYVQLGSCFELGSGPRMASLLATATPMNTAAISWTFRELIALNQKGVALKLKGARKKVPQQREVWVLGRPYSTAAVEASRFFSLVWGEDPSQSIRLDVEKGALDQPVVFLDEQQLSPPSGEHSLFTYVDVQAHLAARWAASRPEERGIPYLEGIAVRIDRLLHGMINWTPGEVLSHLRLPDTDGLEAADLSGRIGAFRQQQTAFVDGLASYRSWPEIFSQMVRCADIVDQLLHVDTALDPELRVDAANFTSISRRLPANYLAKKWPHPIPFLRQSPTLLSNAFETNPETVTIHRGGKLSYLPFGDAKGYLGEICPGYNLGALKVGELRTLWMEPDGGVTTQLSSGAAGRLLQHPLTIAGVQVTGCHQQRLEHSDRGVEQRKVILLGLKPLAVTPKGFIRLDRPIDERGGKFLPPLYLSSHDASTLVERISGKRPSPFTCKDFILSYGAQIKLTALSSRGCQLLFTRSHHPGMIGVGSWVESFSDRPNEITEHITRELSPQRRPLPKKPPRRTSAQQRPREHRE